MKNFKVVVGIGMLACSTLAFAGKTWYTVGAVPEPYAVDSEGYDAEARFISQYNGALMNGTIKPGDLADVSYSDGTIVQFTIGPLFQQGHPFDVNKPAKVIQGQKAAGGRSPVNYTITTGQNLSITMSPAPVPTTITWSISVVTYDGYPSVTYSGSTSGEGSPTSGGGSSSPSPPCTGDCGGRDQP